MSWGNSNHKYSAQKVDLDGYSFASKLEAAVFQLLKFRERAGEIQILQVQDHIYLTAARIGYVADFKCKDMKTGEFLWVEAKGFKAPTWPDKKKLYKFYGPGPLEIWVGDWRRPTLDEVIIPRRTEE